MLGRKENTIMKFKLLVRDIKFGFTKSLKYILLLLLFLFVPLISYISFSKNFSDIINYFIYPDFELNINILKYNLYFISIQIFMLFTFNKYIFDDLFTYNKLILTRYKSRTMICISKIIFIVVSNTILIFVFSFYAYLCLNVFGVKMLNKMVFFKIFVCYTIGAISLSTFNLLISLFFKEIIGFLFSTLFIILNLFLKTTVFPGGGYTSILLNDICLIYSLGYNIIITLISMVLVVFFYKKVDLI